MHMKEGKLVMADFVVAEVYFRNNCTDNPQYLVPVDDILWEIQLCSLHHIHGVHQKILEVDSWLVPDFEK